MSRYSLILLKISISAGGEAIEDHWSQCPFWGWMTLSSRDTTSVEVFAAGNRISSLSNYILVVLKLMVIGPGIATSVMLSRSPRHQ